MSELPPPRPLPPLPRDAHKGQAGRVLAIAGSRAMPGAAILVARGALRAGAGLVTVGCLDPELLAVVPPAVPEAVLADLSGDREVAAALDAAGARAPHAICAGPGLGDVPRTRDLACALLSRAGAPLVLDADLLNALAGRVEEIRAAPVPVVLTPHPGEAKRLLGRDVPRDPAGRVEAALELAERSGAIVCLKGRGTVVADGGTAWTNDTGNPGLAKGGTGDVLTGVLAALLARIWAGGPPEEERRARAFEAARLGVRLHGVAGDLAAEAMGEESVVASDVAGYLGAALRSLR